MSKSKSTPMKNPVDPTPVLPPDLIGELQGKNSALSFLCHILPDVLILLDRNGNILDYHDPDPATSVTEESPVAGRNLLDIFPSAIVDSFLHAIAENRKTKKTAIFRYELIIGAKEHRYDCRLSNIEGRDAFLAIIRDITECDEAKDELVKSGVRYQTLLDNAPFPILITRISDGVFLYANKRVAFEFGRIGESIVGQNALEFYVNPHDYDRFLQHFREKGEVSDFELQLFDVDRNPFWALMSGIGVEFQGEPALMTSINNINEKKIAEMNLLKEHELLAVKILENKTSLPVLNIFDDSTRPTEEVIQASINAAAFSFSQRDPIHVRVEFDGKIYESSYPGETNVFESNPPRTRSVTGLTTFGKPISVCFTYYRYSEESVSRITLEEEKILAGSVLGRLGDIINRRHSDELLHEQDDFLRLMLSQTTFGIVLVDPETLRFMSSNETAFAGLGYTREEFTDLSVCDIEKGATPERIRDIFDRVSKGEIIQRESIHIDKNKDEHYVLVHTYPLRLKGREFFCLYWRDISDEKRKEEEQKRRTDKILLYARLIRKISTLKSGTDGEVAQYIREVTEILGQETGFAKISVWIRDNGSDSLTCLSCYDSQTKSLDHGQQLVSDALVDKSSFLQSERYFQSDDVANDPRLSEAEREFILSSNASAILNTSIFFKGHYQGSLVFSYVGSVHYWDSAEISLCCEVADQIGMAYLNHERIEVTRALQHSEYFLKRAQAVSKTGHWFYDIAGDILSCSDETCRIFGITEGKSRSLSSFLKRSHPSDLDIIRSAFRSANNGTPFHLTQRILVIGQIRWIEMRAEIEFDSDNHPITFLGTVQDITEKVEAANELDRYRKHLEEMVLIRTAELEEATEAAKSANRAKSTFLSNMSHEIRTPINAIVGFAYLLRRDPLTPRQLDELNKLSASSEHLLQIINDILDLSKIEAGKISLETIDFEPARVVDKILNIVQEDAVRKNLPITVSMRGLPPVVRGDGNRVAQILMNLLTNAVKFTDHGGIMLTGQVTSEDDEKVTITFRVHDTGIGISPEHMQRLFDEFEQATNATTRKYGGTGLGLPITKRLTELMGGTIHVESSPHNGSTFEVSIPFRKSEHQAIQPAELSRLAGQRALIIDDSKDECEVLSSLLSDFHLRTEYELTGGRGLKRLLTADSSEDPYRLVFIDYRMPGMDGLELLKALSVSDVQKMPLVIMVTAHGFALKDDPRRNDLSFSLLNKPVTPSRLKDALSSALLDQMSSRRVEEIDDIRRELPLYSQAKILLVEDNPINREVAEGLLSSVGLRAETAENGVIAVERARKKRYDLLLMDLQMPELDGFDATREIRKLPGYKDTPIIAMTAIAFEEDRERCFEAGMTDHLSKPVDPDTLFASLAKWLPASKKKNKPDIMNTPAKAELSLPSSSADIGECLRTIEGLDPDFGLKNLQGNLPWYVKLIDQFITRHRSDAQDMLDYLTKGDLQSVSKIAHGLKGTASTLGFRSIQEQAREIEILIKESTPTDDIRDYIERLGTTLYSSGNDIHRIISSIQTFAPKFVTGSVDEEKVQDLIFRLKGLIERHDMEANTLFDENRELLSRAFGYRIQSLEQHLQLFDYQDAQELLSDMVDRWNGQK